MSTPKTIKLENMFGETIEVRRGPEGQTQIRHSDVDPKCFGEFIEMADRVKQPGLRKHLNESGVDTDSLAFKKIMEGGVMVLRRRSYFLSEEEVEMIREAANKLA